MTVGVIGLGSFGTFITTLLPESTTVLGYDTQTHVESPSRIKRVALEEMCQADAIILAVPLTAYEEVLKVLKPNLKSETLIIDICSVKVKSVQIIHNVLPNHPNLLITHPLFGSHSARRSTVGHHLIVTEDTGALAEKVLAYCKDTLELEVHHMSAEEHDKIMARVHVLTFFVARGLNNMQLEETPFMTPSYKMISDLIAFDNRNSDELFHTIQEGNPYASEIRQQFLDTFSTLATELDKGQTE